MALDASITPLEKLHVSLANLARCVQDIEYLLDALVEELNAIDLEHLEDDAKNVTSEKENAEIKSQLKFVLNDLKGKVFRVISSLKIDLGHRYPTH